jgi:hypothetical protein
MNRLYKAALMSAMIISATACEDVTGAADGSGTTSLSFASVNAPGSLSASIADSTNVGGHAIVLSNADLRLSKIEIEGDSMEIEMKGGLTIVGLPLNGGVTTPVTVPLLPGTYDELELKIESVHLQGTFDGQPFDINVPVLAQLETDLSPPLVVTQSGAENVTVAFSISNWFASGLGTAIDPRNLTPEAAAQLAANITSSMRSFDDHDRDGDHDEDDDDHQRRNRGSGGN